VFLLAISAIDVVNYLLCDLVVVDIFFAFFDFLEHRRLCGPCGHCGLEFLLFFHFSLFFLLLILPFKRRFLAHLLWEIQALGFCVTGPPDIVVFHQNLPVVSEKERVLFDLLDRVVRVLEIHEEVLVCGTEWDIQENC